MAKHRCAVQNLFVEYEAARLEAVDKGEDELAVEHKYRELIELAMAKEKDVPKFFDDAIGFLEKQVVNSRKK
jgi:hypothetical protein